MIPRLEVQKILQQLIEDAGVQGIYFIINALKDFGHYRLVIGDRDPLWPALETELNGVTLQSPEGYYVQRRQERAFYRLPPSIGSETKALCESSARHYAFLLPEFRCIRWADFAELIQEFHSQEETVVAAVAMRVAQQEIDRLSES